MTLDRWSRTEALYHEARALPPEDRGSFLTAACPDDEALRCEVESLLNEPESDGFLAEPPLVIPAHMVSDLLPMTGRSLKGYRLESLLGSGGMGEVYRARDTKLGRDVAIKILPRAFTSDPDRLARFEREARMLAALNHPNICAIYGVEEADGIRFLILELVEGRTLADRLSPSSGLLSKASGLPLREALRIGRQIVDALEVAHDKGIIHRDLKPANIKITPDQVVKVLDFGLAKAVTGDGSSPSLTHVPVGTGEQLRHGAVLGTAAYMSPEQARGLPVDKRTDIWAFGCVLYEMVTGRVTFAGDTVSDSIAKILEREPDWSALPRETPQSIRRLLFRSLTKDPKHRLRDIADVRIEIDAIDEVLPGSLRLASVAQTKTRASWLPWVALVALAAGVGVREAARPADTGENPLANAVFTHLTNWEGAEGGAEISPDGRFVAFLADRDGEVDIWRSQLGTADFKNLTTDFRRLDAPAGILRTFGFTGDGSEIWFGVIGEPKMVIPQTGGAPRPFLRKGDNAPAWAPDDTRLVFFRETEQDRLYIADRTGGDARPIEISGSEAPDWPVPAGNAVHNHNPVWSPDGEWIYFTHGFVRDWNRQTDEMDIWRVPPSGGVPERLTYLNTAITFLTALNTRTLLYVARAEDGSGPWLWMLDVNANKAAERRRGWLRRIWRSSWLGQDEGQVSRRVITGLEQYTSVSASRDGRRVIATRANPTASLWTVPILEWPATDRDVQPYPVASERASAPRFGGTGALFYLSSRGMGDGLSRFQDGGAVELLKGADGPVVEPSAPSPDGRRVAIVRHRERKNRLVIASADGTDVRTLAPSIEPQGSAEWSPDGTSIVTGGKDAGGRSGLFLVPVDRGEPVRIVEGVATNPVWSPQGDLIVYGGSFASGQVSLFAVRPDGSSVELPVIRASPGGYRFLRNGKGLVYLSRPESLDFTLFELATRKSRPLTSLGNRGSLRAFDITPDGKHIVFDRSSQNSDIVLIDLQQK